MMEDAEFRVPPVCDICKSAAWRVVYDRAIRAGAFGDRVPQANIFQCGGCSVQRLAEEHCIPDSWYATEQYREMLRQERSETAFHAAHDALYRDVLGQILKENLRGRILVDVGCGPGGFTDHVAGLVREIRAIEPSAGDRAVLRAKGYRTFDYASSVPDDLPRAGIAVSLQVIEHVEQPRAFLAEIARLLEPGGKLIITTPSRDDALMSLAPDWFPEFFYRVAHRWYFDVHSLEACARAAGLEVESMCTLQRYGLSNALHWLRDRRPCGDARMEPVDDLLDSVWRTHLGRIGRGDTLYAVLRNGAAS